MKNRHDRGTDDDCRSAFGQTDPDAVACLRGRILGGGGVITLPSTGILRRKKWAAACLGMLQPFCRVFFSSFLISTRFSKMMQEKCTAAYVSQYVYTVIAVNLHTATTASPHLRHV